MAAAAVPTRSPTRTKSKDDPKEKFQPLPDYVDGRKAEHPEKGVPGFKKKRGALARLVYGDK